MAFSFRLETLRKKEKLYWEITKRILENRTVDWCGGLVDDKARTLTY